MADRDLYEFSITNKPSWNQNKTIGIQTPLISPATGRKKEANVIFQYNKRQSHASTVIIQEVEDDPDTFEHWILENIIAPLLT